MPLVTKSQYAKSRGVSPAAVTTAIKSGRIRAAVVTRNGKELLDFDLAQLLWGKNSLQKPPTVTAAEAAAKIPAKAPTADELRKFIEGLPEDQIPDLNESRARREHYQAEKAKLEALQGRGELLPADQVRNEAFALAQAVRDAFLTLPDRLAPQLAATMDARVAHQLLTAEIGVALRGLADG